MLRSKSTVTDGDIAAVSPALAVLTRNTVTGELWNRAHLSARDRAVITVSALIARNQTIVMPDHFSRALGVGVTAAELSEIVLHLAFYCGWPNAFSAVAVLKGIFTERGIAQSELPGAESELLPLNEAAETRRASAVRQNFGDVAPDLLQYTTDLLFRNLWLRPALAPRDRSLVTVSALIASGQAAQITYHLNRAMDNGLTKEEASEVLTHLAFYTGWPSVFSAMAIVKAVFEGRQL